MVDNEFNQFAILSYTECLQYIFSFKLLTENRISAQVKIHQQATESQCCDVFVVHRTNNHNTIGEESFILLHHLQTVHFKQIHLLLCSTHTFFWSLSDDQKYCFADAVTWLDSGQTLTAHLGAGGISNSSFPSAFP